MLTADTSSDLWARGVKPWTAYFREERAPPPPDEVVSESIPPHEPYTNADATKFLRRFDPAALQHVVGNTTLNLAFVNTVLRTTGPVISQDNGGLWQFVTPPGAFGRGRTAKHESSYYDWFNWILSYPAAHAVNAVRDRLYQDGGVPVPLNYSEAERVNETHVGSADILHQWYETGSSTPCTPHEFKRDKAMRVDGHSVLDFLYEQAGTSSGYAFRSCASLSTLGGKGKNVLCELINEMITADTGHGIICTQEQYAMIRVTDSLQLEISPVYALRDSPTQADDMALLVLFYAHAALRAGKTYQDAVTTAMRITLPLFPTSVFQPYEGVFRGGVIGRTKLVPKFAGSWFPLSLAWFDGTVRFDSNGITVAYGQLVFLLFPSPGLITKTSHDTSATERLVHEYNVYSTLQDLQGAAIPKVVGIFETKDSESRHTVLMMSWMGRALKTFNELNLHEKTVLFHRLIRLHRAGVQHNDLEPRNVTMSSSGPVIIDFDRASLNHNCPGALCKELLQVAQALGLDPVVELTALDAKAVATIRTYLPFVLIRKTTSAIKTMFHLFVDGIGKKNLEHGEYNSISPISED
ncbi:Kinase-like protein [Mycena indigotica]|uniref:Kinase-like protein n=1 Tax=Mycena indigotica TaxID=2126181 RepID=A0A8H6S5Z0_9AGAR|nr:Kinase-like protein [Mycena indigotica]KAF7292958.1 Kinase-like protein [Mycena indigotica]